MFFGVSNINFPAGGQSAGNQANPFDHIFQGIMNYFGGPTGGLGGILGDYVFGQEQFDQIISQLMEQNQSNRPTPASESFISNLPDVEIIEPQVAKGMDCAVCQEKFNLNEVVTKLTCDHLFHRECIVPWLKTNATCPTCRFVLEPAATSSTTSSSTPRRSTPSTNSASTSTHNSAMNSGNEPSSSMPGSWPPVEGLD
ncbi:hypothetical protein HMI56_004226 [Coelomomyces lativittatus]|nr:hypothetical protein HMI56_004226 [Coelomomyces lativittatus]